MKKWLWIGGLISMVSGAALAINNNIWFSSHTVTGESTAGLCSSSRQKAVIHTVCVNDSAIGTVTLFDQNGATFSVLRSTAALIGGCKEFDTWASSYTNTAGTDLTITYQCY